MSDPEFERWLRDISHNPRVPANDQSTISPAWRQWLRDFFDAKGAAAREVVELAAAEWQLALANAAVSAVLADVNSVTSLRPTVEVDTHDHGIRIAIDGSFQSPSILAVELAAAFAEVADYFQEQLDAECWPVCAQHNTGLHAEVHLVHAVWWCRAGNHEVARVGQLGRET